MEFDVSYHIRGMSVNILFWYGHITKKLFTVKSMWPFITGWSWSCQLQHYTSNTLELNNSRNDNQREYIDFIDAVLFTNPIWDLGLQHNLMQKNNQKIYQDNVTNYTQQCICPCSSIFTAWQSYALFKVVTPYCLITYNLRVNTILLLIKDSRKFAKIISNYQNIQTQEVITIQLKLKGTIIL